MNSRSERIELDEQRLFERAAEWLNLLETAGTEERTEFMEWVIRSPRHLEEFLLASAVAQESARLDIAQMPRVMETLASTSATIARLPVPEREPIDTVADVSAFMRPGRPRRRRVFAALLAGSILTAAAATLWLPERVPDRLEFKTDTLADIAGQFNRYNDSPTLVVIGNAVQARHYSGVFDTNDPASLIEYLRHDPELMVEKRGEELLIRARGRR